MISLLIVIAFVILTCVWLNNLSFRIGIPTLLVFLLLGMLFSVTGLWPMDTDDYEMTRDTCSVALIFIMFYGGFGTRWSAVKHVLKESTLLATLGVVITAALVGLFCHIALGWSLLEGMLFGAIMGSTDAASVFSILRSKRLGLMNSTAPILEMESGSNDPTAYMMTVVLLSALHGDLNGWGIAWNLFAQIGFGTLGGIVIAKVATRWLRHMTFQTSGYDSIFIFAFVLAAYAIPSLVGGSGYLSVYIVGIILGNEEFQDKKSVVNFFDGITGLMQVLIFYALGLLARPASLASAIMPALAIFGFMLFIARPVAVFSILTPFRKYPFRQQAFISFVGLRGAASVVFAIIAMLSPAELRNDVFNIVFCVVLLSIALQGSLIPRMARRLDVIDRNANILNTFNDYSDSTPMRFGRVTITPGSAWEQKHIRDLALPGSLLIAMVIRGEERLLPRGDTLLQSGDEVIIMSRSYEDQKTFLHEKTVKVDSRRVGQPISKHPGDGLVVMVRRGENIIIPDGDTILEAGDKLVILKLEEKK
jgi:NhaP-type Na+/H+ and K+/H+ antiporters with a unique C-terminal domain